MNNNGTPPTAEEKRVALELLEERIRKDMKYLRTPRANFVPLRPTQFNASDFYKSAYDFLREWQRHRGEQFDLEFRMRLVKHAVRYGGFVFYAAHQYHLHFTEGKRKSPQNASSDRHVINAALLLVYFDRNYRLSVGEPLLTESTHDTVTAVLEQWDADVRRHNDLVDQAEERQARRTHLRAKRAKQPKPAKKKKPAARRAYLVGKAARST